jgi:hypothetical protein
MDPVEAFEHADALVGDETRTLVPDAQSRLAIALLAQEFDLRSLWCVAEGVREVVAEDLGDAVSVGTRMEGRR